MKKIYYSTHLSYRLLFVADFAGPFVRLLHLRERCAQADVQLRREKARVEGGGGGGGEGRGKAKPMHF